MNLRANFNEIITRTSTNKESRQDKCRVKRKRRRGAIVGEAMTVSTDADAENESKDESSKLKMNRERAMTMTRSQRQLRPVAHHFHFPAQRRGDRQAASKKQAIHDSGSNPTPSHCRQTCSLILFDF